MMKEELRAKFLAMITNNKLPSGRWTAIVIAIPTEWLHEHNLSDDEADREIGVGAKHLLAIGEGMYARIGWSSYFAVSQIEQSKIESILKREIEKASSQESMRNLEMVTDFIREAGEDSVGLWRIVNAVRHDFGKVAEADVRTATLNVVENLLNRGIEVIDYHDGRGWEKWPEQDSSKILARIEREWSVLEGNPNLGDICWFRLPK